MSSFLDSLKAFFSGSSPASSKSMINISGVLRYHWSKGWLVDTPSRRVAVTCSHSNPAPGTRVGFVMLDPKVWTYRNVLQVFKVISSDGQANDVSILLLEEAAPSWATPYRQATRAKDGSTVRVMTQNGAMVKGKIRCGKGSAVAELQNPGGNIQAGDSGLPWFDAEGRIVAHTKASTAGVITLGPLYSSPFLRDSLAQQIQAAESAAMKGTP